LATFMRPRSTGIGIKRRDSIRDPLKLIPANYLAKNAWSCANSSVVTWAASSGRSGSGEPRENHNNGTHDEHGLENNRALHGTNRGYRSCVAKPDPDRAHDAR
jgi:hypothetical protein